MHTVPLTEMLPMYICSPSHSAAHTPALPLFLVILQAAFVLSGERIPQLAASPIIHAIQDIHWEILLHLPSITTGVRYFFSLVYIF